MCLRELSNLVSPPLEKTNSAPPGRQNFFPWLPFFTLVSASIFLQSLPFFTLVSASIFLQLVSFLQRFWRWPQKPAVSGYQQRELQEQLGAFPFGFLFFFSGL